MRTVLLSLIALSATFISQAQPFTLASGQLTGQTGVQALIAQRYRALRNSGTSGDKEVYVGAPDLGLSANRTESDLQYGNSFQFTITYNRAANTFTNTTVTAGGNTLTERVNISQTVVNAGRNLPLAAMNFFELQVRTGNSSSTVSLTGLTLNGQPVNGSYERANNTGISYWNLRNFEFGSGFTLSGTVTLEGSFSNSAEANRIEYSFGVAPALTILPVSWGSFAARKASAGVNTLEWTTLSEINTSSFIVERSADGNRFQQLGTVAASGVSSTTKAYAFTDNSAPAAAYYRLVQTDLDGKQTYSKTVFVRNAAGTQTALALNGNQAYLNFGKSGQRQVALFDGNGRQLALQSTSNTNLSIALDRYPAGIYLIQVVAAGSDTETFRIRK
jgi:hypothetical protein